MAPLIGINVSTHALDRLHQRGLLPDGKIALAFVYGEVRQALLDGRMAKTQPRWCVGEWGDRGSGNNARGTLRYVWDADHLRCYVIKRGIRSGDGARARKNKRSAGENWTVVTVMAPRESARRPDATV